MASATNLTAAAHALVQRLQEASLARQRQLEELRGRLAAQQELRPLLHALPDKISHKVMVPFGEAAFLEGQLIHTNECRVELGDGYLADMSAKQTIEVIKRREEQLSGQIAELEADLKDMQAQMSKVTAVVADIVEGPGGPGMFEIQEDFDEELHSRAAAVQHSQCSSASVVKPLPRLQEEADEEDAQIMARLEELEMAEARAEEAAAVAAAEDSSSEDMQGLNGGSGADAELTTGVLQHSAPVPSKLRQLAAHTDTLQSLAQQAAQHQQHQLIKPEAVTQGGAAMAEEVSCGGLQLPHPVFPAELISGAAGSKAASVRKPRSILKKTSSFGDGKEAQQTSSGLRRGFLSATPKQAKVHLAAASREASVIESSNSSSEPAAFTGVVSERGSPAAPAEHPRMSAARMVAQEADRGGPKQEAAGCEAPPKKVSRFKQSRMQLP